MDKEKTAVAVGLAVALAVVVGYAYITGVGPLEENPTADLEEPPETESTYSFGEVPETGSEVSGGTDGQVGGGGVEDAQSTGKDDAEAEPGGGTDGGSGDDGSETDTGDSMEVSTSNGATNTQAEDTDGDNGAEGSAEGDDSDEENDEADSDDRRDEEIDRGGNGDGDSNGVDRNKRGTGGSYRRGVDTLDAEPERSGPPFVPELERMERCGETCREATVALQNNMNVGAENVVVYVRLYAGDSTDSDDVVWGENRNLGTLGAGEVHRTTEKVDLSPQQANKVREKGGVVTAKATIESQQATATFVERDSVESD